MRNQLTALDYYVLRSAGSKSPCDLIAFSGKEDIILLVQCKRNGMLSPAEREIFLDLAARCHGSIAIMASSPKRAIVYERVMPKRKGARGVPKVEFRP